MALAGAAAGVEREAARDARAADAHRFGLAPDLVPGRAIDRNLRLAQTSPPRLIVNSPLAARPGERLRFPARLEGGSPGTDIEIMLHRVPAWMSLVGGQVTGTRVKLIAGATIGQVQIVLGLDAPAGRHEFTVARLDRDGQVGSETKLIIDVAAAALPQEQAARKTWADVVGVPQATGPAGVPPAPKAAAPSIMAALPAAAGAAKSEAELVGYAKHLVRECTTCHSLYGNDVGIPVMIGLTKERFLDTMDLYRRDRRDNQAMRDVAKSLSDEELLALALYLGRIKPAPPTDGRNSQQAAAPVAPPPIAKRAPQAADTRSDRWISRGQQLMEIGHIAQARLLFERAAEGGNAQAALQMAKTFDPNTLPWRTGMGLEAEPLKARQWYLHAQSLGAGEEVTRRLADLPAPR